MSATTLRIITDDIRASLKQTFDDAQITQAQVVYWTLLIGNQLKAAHVGKRSSGQFMSTFTNVPVQADDKKRKYFDLPTAIFDYDRDRGVDYIAYSSTGQVGERPKFTKTTFTRTTPKESEWLYQSPYTEPRPREPYFYLVGSRVYLLGVERISFSKVEVGVFSTLDPLTKVDIDAPFPFPDELMHTLKRQVLDMGRWSLLLPEERKNDGSNDLVNNVPTQKTMSVNDSQQEQ